MNCSSPFGLQYVDDLRDIVPAQERADDDLHSFAECAGDRSTADNLGNRRALRACQSSEAGDTEDGIKGSP